MAARKPKNVSAWLGGNRGTVQSGGGRPTGIVDDIAKGIKDIASPWLPAAPGQNRSVTQAQGLARGAAETLDQTFAGGLVKAGTQGNKALAKQAAINAATLGTGYVAGKAAQTAAGAVTNAYKAAKITSVTNATRIPLFHGGPPVLKGGKIDPSITTASTKLLNQQALNSSMPQQINQYRENIGFLKTQLNTPGSFAAQNPRESLQNIAQQVKSLRQLENFAKKANTKNYFTAVDDPSNAYTGGAIQVINPKKTSVQTGFGPSNEFQVAGKQKPVATVLTQKNYDPEAIKLAQQIADRLRKQNARNVLVKETFKNLKRR
jgi:hypothetical protein